MPTINCSALAPDTQPAQEMMLPFGFSVTGTKLWSRDNVPNFLEILMKYPSKFLNLSQLYLLDPI